MDNNQSLVVFQTVNTGEEQNIDYEPDNSIKISLIQKNTAMYGQARNYIQESDNGSFFI